MPWATDAKNKSFIEWASTYFLSDTFSVATTENESLYNTFYTIYIGHSGKGEKPAWPPDLETLYKTPIKTKRILNADYVPSK